VSCWACVVSNRLLVNKRREIGTDLRASRVAHETGALKEYRCDHAFLVGDVNLLGT
jgi:hypothetical protein